MQGIDCTQNRGVAEAAGTQAAGRFQGNPQQKADHLVRSIVLGDFGQKGGGVQGLAANLRKVLSKSDVQGTDVPDEVLKKIEASLHKAAQALADRGYDAKTIDATIDKFRSQLANALDSLGDGASAPASGQPPASTPVPVPSMPSPPQTDVTRVDRLFAREVRRQKGAIDIVTADGDKVSIRFRTRDVVTDSVKQTTSADGTTIQARESVVSRGRLQVVVDGSLDECELAAIGDLLDKVNGLATKFFSGDVQAAFAAASDLGVDSDEIASYQLDLTYSRKIAVYAATARATLPVSPPQTAPSEGSQAPSVPDSQSVSGTTVPADSTAASSPVNAPSDSDAADSTVPQPSEPAMPPATARKTIADYIGDVLSSLGSVEGAGRLMFSLRFKITMLTSALQTLQPAASSAGDKSPAAKSTQLLKDSLQKTVG